MESQEPRVLPKSMQLMSSGFAESQIQFDAHRPVLASLLIVGVVYAALDYVDAEIQGRSHLGV